MERKQEEPVLSKTKVNEYKMKEYREYLSSHNVVLAIVKCTKNCPERCSFCPALPLQSFASAQ